MPVEGEPWTVPSIGLEMNWCPPGTFMMGSPEGEAGRNRENETQQEVTLTKGFFLESMKLLRKSLKW